MHTQSIKEMNGKFECIKISKKKKNENESHSMWFSQVHVTVNKLVSGICYNA